MGIWGSTLKRSNTGELRREDDLTNIIKEFFLNNNNRSHRTKSICREHQVKTGL